MRTDLAYKGQLMPLIADGVPSAHLINLITGERRIAGRKEMTPRRGYQTGDDADEIVIHVAGIP